MNNIEFLNTLIFKLVKNIKSNIYYIAINLFDNYKYTIFITINENLLNNNYSLYTFISNIINNKTIDESLILGEDYFVSKTYATDNSIETGIFDNLYLDNMIYNSSIYDDSYNIDFEYIYKYNQLSTLEFTLSDLQYFYKTFAKTILDNVNLENIDFQIQPNNIYNICLNYLLNYKNDNTIINLKLLLNSTYNITTNINNTSSCSCNTSSIDSTSSSLTCADIYIESLLNYIEIMLGDTNFYKEWFLVNNEPNIVLIDTLLKLLDALKNSSLNINSISSTENQLICDCSNLENISCGTTNIINNYIKVLEYVKENKIDENKNKIKIYGNSFGTLLSKLEFTTGSN